MPGDNGKTSGEADKVMSVSMRGSRKAICVTAALITLCCLFLSCSGEITGKKRIIGIYRDNEAAFTEAAISSDFSSLKSIAGVNGVTEYDNYVEIYFGGKGFGPETSYYGIIYTKKEIGNAVLGSMKYKYDSTAEGSGVLFTEKEGDNSFYFEPVGDGYYYFEMDF